ncbi:MAG: hypothetical protein R3293_11875 [Candidatus Promineifilaceae bacterium]|nr:hypothetical protein [Candidatus Promineifilaceae bacterium]
MSKKPTSNWSDDKDRSGSQPGKPGIGDFASGTAYQPKDRGGDDTGYDGRDAYSEEYGYDDTWDSYTDKSSGSTSWSNKDTASGYDDYDPGYGSGADKGNERNAGYDYGTGKPSSNRTEESSDKYTGDPSGDYQGSRVPATGDDGGKYPGDNWQSEDSKPVGDYQGRRVPATGDDGGKYPGDNWQREDSRPGSGSGGGAAAATRDIWRVWSWVTTRCQFSEQRMQREFDEAAELGLTDVVLHLNSIRDARQSDTFHFLDNRSLDAMRSAVTRATEELRRRSIDCHLMVFPAPHRGYTESMIDALIPLAQAAPIRSILLDAESNWRRRSRPDYDGSVGLIEQRLRPRLAASSVALGFTDFTLNDAGRALARICDYVMPQAYSTRSSGMREPGRMQADKHELYRPLQKPLVMAAAAWNIRPPAAHSSYTPAQTMQYTWEAVEQLTNPDVVEMAYWSLPAAHSTRARDGQPPFNTLAESQSILQFLSDRGRQVRQAHTFVPGARFL